ncbi:MAG: glycoside hydrolase family 43 protein [Clostridia bacterium]|nr:glycoside hydrolase family 43 protein [Clostridia bacterium]
MIITDVTNIGDPQIILHNGVYYEYSTCGEFGCCGFFARKSTDLIHWSEPIHVFDTERPGNGWGFDCFWAPEVVKLGDRFVMHYSANVRAMKKAGSNKHNFRIGVAVSDSPEGPFIDVYGRPMFDLGYNTIDGSVLMTDNGNYFYYSRDCSENIIDGKKVSQLYCVRMSDDLTSVFGEHRLVATPELPFELKSLSVKMDIPHIWNEGPNVIEYGGRYIMNYSANFYASNDYSICMAVADDPMGPWIKPESANPVFCSGEGLFGAGHNAFFRTVSGELYTSFHVQTNPDKPSGDRRIVIGKVVLTEDAEGNIFEKIVNP